MDKIKVYIRNEEVVVGQIMIGRPLQGHWCTAKETLKTSKVMSQADMAALEVVKEIAEERGIKVEVIDVSTLTGRLKATFEGVKNTPTIIIGGEKIEGIPNRDQILKLIQ
jgi:pyruvate/2-oxoglutarate/acetoin dehydrogenase E1 component